MSPGSSTGRVVAGRYRVVSPIGSGGHGVVDLAEDLLNGGRRVALKRLEGIVGAGDPDPAAEHLRWFRHPRWAEVLDEGRLDATGRFQVLRYVDGKSLDHIELPRPADEILAFLEDGARVLGALHARGLIHYDVTPGNFLREERNGAPTFTLTDGGLANLGPVRGIARGTVMYMAPEVADGAPHDHRADLYALGLVAFRLATGRDPWVGGAGDVLGGRRREAAPSIRTFRPDSDARVERVIASLLERDPDRRLADAAAVLALLCDLGRPSAAKLLDGEAFAMADGGFLVGRDEELTRFRTACRALLTGTRAVPLPAVEPSRDATERAESSLSDNVLLVSGPTGSGGTRLVGEYAAIARVEGVPVLALSGREGAADRRGPLRRLADGIALLTGQSDPLAATSRADARAGREELGAGDDVRMTERFVALCDKMADKTPLVLIIEDFEELQDTAKESIRVLARHLISRSELSDGRAPTRVLLVVDHGAEAPDAFLLPDAIEPRRPIQALAPLGADAIRALATDRFAALDPLSDDLETVRAVTEGLPRLVVSVMAQAIERGHLRRENGIWIWDASATASYELDRSISPAAARALATLTPAARELAQYLALLEVPVPEEFLLRLVSPEAIREFTQTPLASVSYEGDRPRYALSARNVRSLLQLSRLAQSETLREALRRATEGIPIDLIPELARLACDADDMKEALALLASAPRMPSSTWGMRARIVALRALERCLKPTAPIQYALTRLLTPGPASDALAHVISAQLTEVTPHDIPTVERLARYYIRSHDARRSFDLCARAATATSLPNADPIFSARLSVIRLRAAQSLRSAPVGSQYHIEAIHQLRKIGATARRRAPDLTCEYHLARGRDFIALGQFSKAMGVHRRALRRSIAAHDGSLLIAALNNCAIACRSAGDLVTAERYLLRALRVRLASGDPAGASGQAHNLARVYQRAGRLRDAASLLHRAVAMATRHGHARAHSLALGILSEVQDQIGSTDLARMTGLRALSTSRRSNTPQLVLHNLLICAELASALGDAVSAREMLREAVAVARRDDWCDALPTLRLTSLLIANNLGTRRHSTLRVARGRPRKLLRILRLARDARSLSMPLAEDTARAAPAPALRRLIAALLRVDRSRPHADWSGHVDSLKSPALKGSSRRLGLGLLLDALHAAPTAATSRTTALGRLAELSRRFDLPRMQARALALSARDAIASGDFTQAATDLCETLDALETRDVRLSGSATWRRPLVPREIWAVASTLTAGEGGDLDSLRDNNDSHLVLHAMAHRLSRRSSRSSGVDNRREAALRAVLASTSRARAVGNVDVFLSALSSHARTIIRAERACVVLVATEGGARRIIGMAPDLGADDSPALLSHTVIERALAARAPMLLHDVFGDSELIGRPSVLSMSLRSVLCVPILRGGEAYGVMYADSSERAGSFDSVDMDVLSLFADQAAAALETARLFTDLQSSYAELKAAQDRLVHGERLRVIGEMTSGVAHEFNNLLTAILARVQLMGLGGLPPETHEHLRLIEKASLDAASVVRRLQGFSRSQRQGTHRVTDLAEVGGDVVEFLRPLWTTRRRHGLAPIVVRYRATRGLLVSGDATELREVFTNLLKNSLEALEVKGGAVDIALSEQAGIVRATIEDDGDGIAPAVLNRLFTPFLTTKGDRGTGLGLCLCQQILERHGSSLKIESGQGRGTHASFELHSVQVDPKGVPSAVVPVVSRQLRVLVVDDDPNVLQPLCDYLTLSGLHVSGADGGQRALESATGFHPDIVVSDISMPGMDGIELCAALRESNVGLPVILMSGQASEVDLGRVRSSGASALLPKPFTMRQVLELLKSIGAQGPKRETPVPSTSRPGGRSEAPLDTD